MAKKNDESTRAEIEKRISDKADSRESKFYKFLPQRLKRALRTPNIYGFADERLKEIQMEKAACKKLADFDVDPAKFEICDPGDGLTPCEDYRSGADQMFQHIADFRRKHWSLRQSVAGRSAEQHALTEVDSLRSEIVDLKSQITSSERITAVWMVGTVFAYSKDIVSLYPILFAPIFLSVFGFIRFKEYQRNAFDLDCYLREVELVVRPDAGWVSFFFRTRVMGRFFATRNWFWVIAMVVSLTIPIFGWIEYLSPQPLRMGLSKPSDPILEGLHNFFGYSGNAPR